MAAGRPRSRPAALLRARPSLLRHHEHGAVEKLLWQRGETVLAPLLALLLGPTELGAAIPGGRRGGIAGRLNRERITSVPRSPVARTLCFQPSDEASSRRP